MIRRAIYLELLRRVIRGVRLVSHALTHAGSRLSDLADHLGTQRLFYDLGFTDWKGKRVTEIEDKGIDKGD